MARQIAENVAWCGITPPLGEIDVSLYRDDLSEKASRQPLKTQG